MLSTGITHVFLYPLFMEHILVHEIDNKVPERCSSLYFGHLEGEWRGCKPRGFQTPIQACPWRVSTKVIKYLIFWSGGHKIWRKGKLVEIIFFIKKYSIWDVNLSWNSYYSFASHSLALWFLSSPKSQNIQITFNLLHLPEWCGLF